MNTNIEISIITTMYLSSSFVEEFYRRSSVVAKKVGLSYEIVFVNDGSPDDSLDIAKEISFIDKRVRVVDLSRNFGHHRAIMVGLEFSRGNKVFLIDCDLEENPNSLEDFFLELKKTNADVIYGIQNNRSGTFIKRVGGRIFWKLFNIISDAKVDPKVITSRLMTRRYVNSLLMFKEKELFLAGIFELNGFNQLPLVVDKTTRSETSYTFKKRIELLVNAVTSFSSRPLIFVFYIGVLISFFSGIAAFILLLRKFLYDDFLVGWASVIVSVWLIGGITIFCIGLIGIYISKIFQEVKDRPLSIVKTVYETIESDKN